MTETLGTGAGQRSQEGLRVGATFSQQSANSQDRGAPSATVRRTILLYAAASIDDISEAVDTRERSPEGLRVSAVPSQQPADSHNGDTSGATVRLRWPFATDDASRYRLSDPKTFTPTNMTALISIWRIALVSDEFIELWELNLHLQTLTVNSDRTCVMTRKSSIHSM